MVEMAMFNVQRVRNSKVSKPKLQMICSGHHLMMLYTAVRSLVNISNCIRVMEQTQNYEALTDGHSKFWRV